MYTYILMLDNLFRDAKDETLLPFVSNDRRNKLLSYKNPAKRKLSLYSSLLVRMSLCTFTNIPISKLIFSYNEYNKPILLSVPSIHFNLSHSKNCIICCINSHAPVGVDVEYLRPAPLGIMDMSFHNIEKNYVLSTTIDRIDHRFFKIWTQKEAYTKYLGTGLIIPTTDFNTLDPAFAKHFSYWCDDTFSYCIYSELFSKNNFVKLNMPDIQKYYLAHF